MLCADNQKIFRLSFQGKSLCLDFLFLSFCKFLFVQKSLKDLYSFYSDFREITLASEDALISKVPRLPRQNSPQRLLFEFPVLICRLQVWSTKLAKPLFFHQLFVFQIDKCETASKSPPGIILNLQAKPSLVEILGWICGQHSKLLVCAEIGLPMCINSTMIIITWYNAIGEKMVMVI